MALTGTAAQAKPKEKQRRRRRWRVHKNDVLVDCRSRILHLTLDVNELRQQIAILNAHKLALTTKRALARMDVQNSAVRIAVHMYELIQFGYYPENRPHATEVEAFYRFIIDSKMTMAAGRVSVDQLLAQYATYAGMLQGFQRQLKAVQLVDRSDGDADGVVVECKAVLAGVITRKMLQTVFPHVYRDELLVNKLIGRIICVRTSNVLYFNSSGRVVRYLGHADLFNGLRDVLERDPQDLARVMTGALVNEEGLIVKSEPKVIDNQSYDAPEPVLGSTNSMLASEKHSMEYIMQ